ncbi:MAG: hypothetical protein ACKVOR_10330 [Flavobacteriales bacterium]
MKSILLTFLYCLVASFCLAQKENDEEYLSSVKGPTCRDLHFGLNVGFNNHGAVAAQIEYISDQGFSFDYNIGLGGWFLKQSVDFKYYFGECGVGWSAGVGISHCANQGIIQAEMLVIDSTNKKVNETVTMQVFPLTQIKIFGARYWPLGQKMRFFMKFGYEIRVSSKTYIMKSNHVLADTSKQTLEIMAGGGLLLAAGFSF